MKKEIESIAKSNNDKTQNTVKKVTKKKVEAAIPDFDSFIFWYSL